MNDLIVSWIRTIVPVVVGAVLTRLADRFGIVDVDTEAAVAVVGTIATGLYYALARFLESRYSAAGLLLGLPKAPTYAEGENVPL